MLRELEAVAYAVTREDYDLLPLAVRRAYDAGATVDQVRAAVGVGCCMGEVSPAVREWAWEVVTAWGSAAGSSPEG